MSTMPSQATIDEKAVLLEANMGLFDEFVNGADDETVLLGGTAYPTLANFITSNTDTIYAISASVLANKVAAEAAQTAAEAAQTGAESAQTAAEAAQTAAEAGQTGAEAAEAAAEAHAATALSAVLQQSSTSSTSIAIGTGEETLTVEAGKAFQATQDIKISSSADPTVDNMYGVVTSYDVVTGELVVEVGTANGSGTHTDWVVVGSGEPGVPQATIFTQDAEPSTSNPENSIWIDTDSTDLDLYVLTGDPLAWTDTGEGLKGDQGETGATGAAGAPGEPLTVQIGHITAIEVGEYLITGFYHGSASLDHIFGLMQSGTGSIVFSVLHNGVIDYGPVTLGDSVEVDADDLSLSLSAEDEVSIIVEFRTGSPTLGLVQLDGSV